jgi:hypothetical protein
MWLILGKIIPIFWVAGVVLSLAACSSGREDVAPMTPVKAQSAPQDEPVSTPTNLPTEIMEPISPVSPVSPITPTIVPTAAPAGQAFTPLPGSQTALAAAMADLSQRTGTPADQISLVSMEAVDWSDTSLGCPQEGMMYAQVITPGYKIILQAQGQTYEYHTDQTTSVVLCQK